MEITNTALEWTSENVEIWRQFLNTPTGQRLIPKMLEATPGLLPNGDTNSILIRSGEVRGVQLAANTLLDMTRIAPEAPVETQTDYPDLTDDSKWPGEKLKEEVK